MALLAGAVKAKAEVDKPTGKEMFLQHLASTAEVELEEGEESIPVNKLC